MNITDADAMTMIQIFMDGKEWSADTLDNIADVVRETGRVIRDPNDVESEQQQ